MCLFVIGCVARPRRDAVFAIGLVLEALVIPVCVEEDVDVQDEQDNKCGWMHGGADFKNSWWPTVGGVRWRWTSVAE